MNFNSQLKCDLGEDHVEASEVEKFLSRKAGAYVRSSQPPKFEYLSNL